MTQAEQDTLDRGGAVLRITILKNVGGQTLARDGLLLLQPEELGSVDHVERLALRTLDGVIHGVGDADWGKIDARTAIGKELDAIGRLSGCFRAPMETDAKYRGRIAACRQEPDVRTKTEKKGQILFECPHCSHQETADEDEPPTCDHCIRNFCCVLMKPVDTDEATR